MAEQKNPVNVTIKCQHAGYGFDLSASLYVDQIPGLVGRLQDVGIDPANTPYVWAHAPAPSEAGTPTPTPTCPVHGVVMKPSKHGNGFYCSAVVGIGPAGKKVYCQERAGTNTA